MGRLTAIGTAIATSGLDAQLVIVAGRNEALRRRLAAMTWAMPTSVHGFVDTMPVLMRAADVVVTKAGPHTVMEALTLGCPVILSGFVPAQEEGVVRLVLGAGAGILADTPAKVVDALRTLFDPAGAALVGTAAAARRLARPTAAVDIARLVLGLAGSGRRAAPGIG
jgi:1,2-diacylglycerol 3-beta-galactosyltransferase